MSKTLRAIYTSVKARVKTRKGLTATFGCPTGVRQGCCISPILFSFFLSDLKSFVSADSHGIDIDLCKIYTKSAAAVVQWLARLSGMQEIRGSSPGRGMTDFCTSICICLY